MDKLSAESIKQIAETQELADKLSQIGLSKRLFEIEKRLSALESQNETKIAKAKIDEWNRLISITRINGEQVINQATYSLALDRIAELSQTLKEHKEKL